MPSAPHANRTGVRRVSSVDTLLPNTDSINQTTFTPNGQDATSLTVVNGARFQVGDMVRPGNSTEVMQVTGVAGSVLTVVT